MTIDHRPFLRPGVDLCTAEDVARELRRLGQAGRTYTYEAADAIDDRLDRERRQACRRAAVDAWERFAGEARSWGRWPTWADAMGAAVWDGTGDAVRAQCAERMLRDLALALAFRAAARAK